MKKKTFPFLLAIALILCIISSYSSAEAVSPIPLNAPDSFSGVISYNVPFWLNASQWATEELNKAEKAGLIPDLLKGVDLTRPITREEFAELAVKLYEKSTGKAAIPSSPNPFLDTSNPEILKAYQLGVTTGISTEYGLIFSPYELINREQCATMLYRVIKVIVPEWDFNIAGIRDFPDQKHISSWAVEGTKYLAKLGIIKGDQNGNFMPRAVTPEQEATGYGTATREAAVLMSVRSFEQIAGPLDAPTGDGPSPTGSVTPPPQQDPETPSQSTGTAKDLIGEWSRGGAFSAEYINGNISVGTMAIINGEYYQFNEDGTYRYIISTLGGTVGGIRYESIIVYDSGTYKVDGNTIIFSNIVQTAYKGTPLVLVHKDKKIDEADELKIEEFDLAGGRFKTMMGWFEKKN